MQDPARIVEISTAYWQSATLTAAIELRIPTIIGSTGKSAEQIAAEAGCDTTALIALLEGLCGLALLDREDDIFVNTPIALSFLVEGQPAYMGKALMYNADVYPKWSSLAETIRNGAPVHSPSDYLGDTETQTNNFVYGMHHRALSLGHAMLGAIDLSDRTHLFDLGGGPGTYSALLAERNPNLNATVGDLGPVIKIAKQIVNNMAGGDRVQCVEFDYYRDTLPTEYDAVLISGVLHREEPEGVRKILQTASNALHPGGILYISDVMVNDTRTGPLFATMFSINMRVLANHGRSHSVREQTEWLAEHGLTVTEVTKLPAPIHYTIIKAEKKP